VLDTHIIDVAEDFDWVIPRFCVEILDCGLFEKASVDMFSLTEETAKYVGSLIQSGWSKRIASEVLRKRVPPVSRWELLGWRAHVSDDMRHAVIFVKIWA
jgi:hypothetical protein